MYAVNHTSPSDIYSFFIMAILVFMYMVFRDVVFWQWPNFFIEDSSNPQLQDSFLTYWKDFAVFNILI